MSVTKIVLDNVCSVGLVSLVVYACVNDSAYFGALDSVLMFIFLLQSI